jgi:YD repeat-containing protein
VFAPDCYHDTGVLIFAVSLGAQTSPNGPVSYAYDEMGRLIAVFDGVGNAAVYSYDAVGNITSIARYTAAQVSVLSFTPSQASIGSSISIFGTGFSTTPGQNTVLFQTVTKLSFRMMLRFSRSIIACEMESKET